MAINEDSSSDSGDTIAKSISACFTYESAAHKLTAVRGLRYNNYAAIERPRTVAQVWGEIVSLFTLSNGGQQQSFTSDESKQNEPADQLEQNASLKDRIQESTLHLSPAKATHQIKSTEPAAAMETLPDSKAKDLYPSELQGLVDAMKDAYKDETEFNIALFNALRTCLKKKHLVEACSNEKHPEKDSIIFKYGQTSTHAIAISREVNAERKPVWRRLRTTTMGKKQNSSGLVANTRLDHCPSLLQRNQKGAWKLVDCYSDVELKMGDAKCCALFDSNDDVQNQLRLENRHGALAQAMVYTLAWALPSLARVGQLETEIPWAVIVAKRLRTPETKKSKTDDDASTIIESKTDDASNVIESNRWVSGKIYVPAECGDPFQYAVTGYGGRMGEEATADSVVDALSVYLETILFGLKAAKLCLDFQAGHGGRWPDPCAVSGKNVVIGGQLIQLDLRASSTVGRFPNHDENDRHWDSSQGEIFTGRVNLSDLQKKVTIDDQVYFSVFDQTKTSVDGSNDLDVVVKVSSQAVHNYLIIPDKNLLALSYVSKNPRALSAISKVLYAIYDKNPVGLITITADLSLKSCKVLRPMTCGVPITELWGAFEVVVNDVLVPMASLNMIHPDIRPGWDVTSNILCRVVSNVGSEGSMVTMQLIDYESIVSLKDWGFAKSDHRYIECQPDWNAFTFLWWQCANVANAWHGRLFQEDVKKFDLQKFVKSGEWEKWYTEANVPGDVKLTEQGFKDLFDCLRTVFVGPSANVVPLTSQAEREIPQDDDDDEDNDSMNCLAD